MSDFLNRWQVPQGKTSTDAPRTFEHRWSTYYQAVEGRPPRDTLLFALDRFDIENQSSPRSTVGFAVDLGCGDGRDTVELLRRRWRVLAIDGNAEAIARLRQRSDLDRRYLEMRVQRFEALTLPPNVDLINASFCLPFCPTDHFAELWEELGVALRSGGRFCGQLFGDRDSWAPYDDITCHTRQDVEQLLSPFDIEQLDEEEHSGKTALGEEKYWHLFHIVARKH
ncbi:class I SAM-dependent methyltransferase [Vacuolonema iberomarrocanum]|uniref:class I SAM-dependent methyltransferase n=1 Tax=Vacuolonema iberomarrocanum TaxID=3454632 RepID=UPI0019F3F8A4|nr:class I SAM-dependent methyltransferase [filamentous cyanobacterium LEGE 07170]